MGVTKGLKLYSIFQLQKYHIHLCSARMLHVPEEMIVTTERMQAEQRAFQYGLKREQNNAF